MARFSLLYAVGSRQGVLKQPYVRREEGKEDEAEGEDGQHGGGLSSGAGGQPSRQQEPCFIEIGKGGGQKKDGDIEPIGGFAHGAVVGIKENGDQRKPQEDPPHLDTGKIGAVRKTSDLYDGNDQHGPKQELHMLPGGFVDSREGGDPGGLPQPIIQKVEECTAEGGDGKAEKLGRNEEIGRAHV